MAKVFKSLSQIEGFLNKAIEEAVKKACERLSKKLKEFILCCASRALLPLRLCRRQEDSLNSELGS